MTRAQLSNFFQTEGNRLIPVLSNEEIESCVSNTKRFVTCGMEEEKAVHRALCAIRDVNHRHEEWKLGTAPA